MTHIFTLRNRLSAGLVALSALALPSVDAALSSAVACSGAGAGAATTASVMSKLAPSVTKASRGT